MGVPFCDIRRRIRLVRHTVLQRIDAVLERSDFVLGEDVQAFERRIASYLGATGGVGVSSGSDALMVSLMAMGLQPGDVVVTTPYTFFATAGSPARLGLRLRFADIDPKTYNLDPFKAIEVAGDTAAAIVVVHLFGHMAEMAPLLEWAGRRGTFVLEDAAQAIGASCYLGMAGTLGTAGAFSFFPTKNLGGLGDGGLVTSMDERFLERVRILRQHGASPKHHHSLLGGNFRLDTIQAAALDAMLDLLPQWTERRRRLAARYARLFEEAGLLESGDVVLPVEKKGFRHVYNQYVVRVRDRDRLAEHLRRRDIGFALYYPLPLHLQPCLKGLGYEAGSLPNAERASRETIALPIFPELTDDEQEEVVGAIRDFYG